MFGGYDLYACRFAAGIIPDLNDVEIKLRDLRKQEHEPPNIVTGIVLSDGLRSLVAYLVGYFDVVSSG